MAPFQKESFLHMLRGEIRDPKTCSEPEKAERSGNGGGGRGVGVCGGGGGTHSTESKKGIYSSCSESDIFRGSVGAAFSGKHTFPHISILHTHHTPTYSHSHQHIHTLTHMKLTSTDSHTTHTHTFMPTRLHINTHETQPHVHISHIHTLYT